MFRILAKIATWKPAKEMVLRKAARQRAITALPTDKTV
jgi:hypothetical protein